MRPARGLAAGTLALALAGCAGGGAALPPPAGDAGIREAVAARLAADEATRGSALEVESRDGFVTLRGRASDPRAADRAVGLARGVAGVRAVRSELEVARESP